MQTITPMQEKKEKLSAMQLCDFCAQTAAMLHSGCSLEDACAAHGSDVTELVNRLNAYFAEKA